ncbi:MAG TPA: OmpA family protein [Thermoanaerobaculia bacterium]|jgi:outer membrane protein OmpA-like peptidoglycan-associated protein|nr:OmpA family protein [Thermoanaerobaculia bacterium]
MSRKAHPLEEDGPSFWPAVADVFIGFLAFVLIAGMAAYTDATSGTQEPPPSKQDFQKEFEEAFSRTKGVGIGTSEKPEVKDEGFSELNIYFPASFLFKPCHADLVTSEDTHLGDLKILFKRFDAQIQRVQITGHTDTDRPLKGGECYRQGIHSNWELSARRAITVLELLAPDDKSGLDPRKIWATALGEYDPVEQGGSLEAKARNRRIEVLVRFRELR